MRRTSGRAPGFTLVELMIVIGVLGLLAAVLLPNLLGASETGKIAETRARIEFLAQQAKAFERNVSQGYYPPDDFEDPERKQPVAKDNRANTGIESLVVFLCRQRVSADSLTDHETWLANTDDDRHTSSLPGLDRAELMEVVDAWGMPLAYFADQFGGYESQQQVRAPEGETLRVTAVRNPRTGKYAAAGKFQIVSAGADGLFGTADDITYPELPPP